MRIWTVIICLTALVACKENARESSKEGMATATLAEAKAPSDAAPVQRKPPKLVRSKPLRPEARMALRAKMRNHGDDIENLLWAAIMLDYESTAEIADRMADQPTLARAGAGQEDTINAQLPEEFFELQSQLTASIGSLRSAARARHEGAMASEYSKIATTCIKCHGLYLRFPYPPEE